MQKVAKKIITGAVSAVGAFGLAVMPVMAATTVTAPKWSLFDGDLGALINMILNVVFGIGIIMALVFLILGAFNWITSGGDKAKTAAARDKIVAAVVGLILLAATWGILTLVINVIYGSDVGVQNAINENIVNVKNVK